MKTSIALLLVYHKEHRLDMVMLLGSWVTCSLTRKTLNLIWLCPPAQEFWIACIELSSNLQFQLATVISPILRRNHRDL